jgi:hypothetical protein
VKTYDNKGRLKSEINTTYTQDGSVITTTTLYSSANGQPIAQNISVRDSRGKVTTQNTIGGKLLP